MRPAPINQYLRVLSRSYLAGDATEATYYPTLEALVESLGRDIDAVSQPKRRECGTPDFQVKKGDLAVGYIEAKDLGASLDDAEQDEQIRVRYRPTLDNLILTNYLEFRWYVRGDKRRAESLSHLQADGRTIRTTTPAAESVLDLLKSFLAQDPQGANDARDLATRLARYTHEIRNVVVQGFATDAVSGNLRGLRDIIKEDLVPDLTDEQFADMFAQTLTYGFFAAWCNHPLKTPFQRLGAAADIPKTNPLLRRIFELNTLSDLADEPHAGYVDDVVQLLRLTDKAAILQDFARKTGREDPVVHFYETFLKEYDPKLRELRGVYYTPPPVVSYMVRSVDHLLKTRFGLPNGLADTAQCPYQRPPEDGRKETATGPRVLILDPACGTGAFLYAIVDHIRDGFMRARRMGAWSGYVKGHLLPRLFGFELLMAPYAVAHLKLGLQLAGQDLPDSQQRDYAYDFASDDRLGVYLTNTLDEAIRRSGDLFGLYNVITKEGNEAAEIKRGKPIMVVIGNPPYSGHSANRSWDTKNGKRTPTFIGKLLQDYYKVDGQPLGEKNPKWLQDDYVKFLRFGQWRIEQTAEQTGGGGILALITNHSYLDNPTFRGMRQQLMQAFTDIYLLDLHGNSRKKEICPDGSKDENVFDIQQGVAIAIFVKTPSHTGPARVCHAELWGLRKTKETYLSEQACNTVEWRELYPQSPAYLFVPQDASLQQEYQGAHSLTAVFPLSGVGMTTARDSVVIDFEEQPLLTRAQTFRDSTLSDADLCAALGMPVKKGWNIAAARKSLQQETDLQQFVKPVLYRPFDVRLIFYHDALVWRTVRKVMHHMLPNHNLALCIGRAGSVMSGNDWNIAFCSGLMEDFNVFYRGGSANLPLYLYPEQARGQTRISRDQKLKEAADFLDTVGHDAASQQRLVAVFKRLFPNSEYPRWPNLNPLLLADLEGRLELRFVPDGRGDLKETFGPEDVFNYIYAILHSPTYRTRYAEFLKRDFPRLPFTSNRDLFAALSDKGRDLVALHLLESPLLAGVMPDFPERGTDTVERVRYDDNHRVYINKTQYFANVPGDVWRFHVGGYQVCEKWLKDRKGRKLEYGDQEHYQKIVVALGHTIRLMAEIDASIPAWPLT